MATIRVNGAQLALPDDRRVSLLDFLRERAGLPGTKKGCDQGACGACTVLCDGERILGCLTLAVQVAGRDITTIEGLADNGTLHPLQQLFVEEDGFQCGYCTPGQICSALGLIAELRRGVPSVVSEDLTAQRFALGEDELRERMSGNVCRCGAYTGIRAAIRQFDAKIGEGEGRMNPFDYSRASSVEDAVVLADATTKFLGGGTNLVDLMRENIEHPARLVDVTGLSAKIEERADGGLVIGAAVRNTAVAEHPVVRQRYPMLARAILAGASPQIRNMATVGGNILQRTRCVYFYDSEGSRCNKRTPGAGCDALGGFNRYHAVLGTSPQCVATHPSDMCVALAALDASVHVSSARGTRTIPITDLHRAPGATPHVETNLEPGELITAVELPALPLAQHSSYRKVRDRASYAFALVAVAAALEVDGDRIRDVRLALGGVATKPWRAWRAEEVLRGALAQEDVYRAAIEQELAEAVPLKDNAFKIELAKRTTVALLLELTGAPV